MSNFGEVMLKGTHFDPKAKDAVSKTLIMKPYTRHEPEVYGIAFDYADSVKEMSNLLGSLAEEISYETNVLAEEVPITSIEQWQSLAMLDLLGSLAEEISYKTNVLAEEDPITSIEQWQTLAWRAAQSLLKTDKYSDLGIRAPVKEEDRLHGCDDDILSTFEMWREPLKTILVKLNSNPADRSISYEFLRCGPGDLMDEFYKQISHDTVLNSKIQTLWAQHGETHVNDWLGRTLENRYRELSGICAQQHESQESGGREGGAGPSASNGTPSASSTQAGARLMVVSRSSFDLMDPNNPSGASVTRRPRARASRA